ncbi:MAG: GlsB/YeaQ/YmgE family stress response membrane protein [Anaerolineaceae bacterium]|nr:GlsB/YeaQ/YmgE family stress response membrane protein [Anaerolineaceae bacterium]
MGMGILSWIVVGLIAGWLAGQVMRGGGYGLIGDIIVGVVGGLLGGWIASTLLHIGAGVNGINLESILVAFGGAVVLLVLLRVLRGGSRRILR